MSRGLSKLQHSILAILDAKHGMASTTTLKTAMDRPISDQSFYRSIHSLEKRGEIRFYRGGHTGGLVCRTHGNVLLIDSDAPPEPTPAFPNLALMKLSAYHKACGDYVTLLRGLKIADGFEKKFDIAYISCVFTKNARAARRLAKRLSTSMEVHLGGSGVDLKTTLPAEIENTFPDYELYPECDYSIGMTMRGCTRSCPFCIIKDKEGTSRPTGDIYAFYNPNFKSKKIVLLDNNILGLPAHFAKIASQIKKEGLRVDWNQGLDLRLVTPENAKILAGLHFSPYMRFAWDDIKSEPQIRRGIQILKENGALKNPAVFYVLSGFNSTFEEDLYRVKTLRDLGQKAFLMLYDKKLLEEPRYRHLSNWTNARVHFFTRTFEEFVTNRENGVEKQKAAERKQRLEAKKNPPPILHGCEISLI